MNTLDIKETKEVVTFASKFVRGILDANADGSISKWEAVKVAVANMGEAATAFDGIKAVPLELRDITPDELDELYIACAAELKMEDRTSQRDLFNVIWTLIRDCIQAWRNIESIVNPPKAEVLEEGE